MAVFSHIDDIKGINDEHTKYARYKPDNRPLIIATFSKFKHTYNSKDNSMQASIASRI
jgi:hypothetical protein